MIFTPSRKTDLAVCVTTLTLAAWAAWGPQTIAGQPTSRVVAGLLQEKAKEDPVNKSELEKATKQQANNDKQSESPKSEQTENVKDSAVKKVGEQEKEEPPVESPPTPIDWSLEGTLELNFDHLKFNIKPDEPFEVSQLTDDLIKLRGRKIRIRGFIRPSFRERDIKKFVFVRDNQECCFGPGAALFDCMIVNMGEDHSANFSTRSITVEGTFDLKPFRGPDKKIWAVFQLKDSMVK